MQDSQEARGKTLYGRRTAKLLTQEKNTLPFFKITTIQTYNIQ